jgi:hypothetical protein
MDTKSLTSTHLIDVVVSRRICIKSDTLFFCMDISLSILNIILILLIIVLIFRYWTNMRLLHSTWQLCTIYSAIKSNIDICSLPLYKYKYLTMYFNAICLDHELIGKYVQMSLLYYCVSYCVVT